MNRSLTIFLSAVALTSGAAVANAQTVVDGFDVQSFKLSPALSANYLNLHQARALRGGQFEVGLMFNYANDPLVFYNEDDERDGKLVGNLLTTHVMAAVGIADRLELGLDLPFILVQDSDLPEGSTLFDGGSGGGIGDIRFVPKVLLLGPPLNDATSGPALAFSIDTYLPTGDTDALQGGGFRAEPRLAFDYIFDGGLRWGVNLGYFIRPASEFLNVEVDDSITFGTAADIPLGEGDRFHLVPEIRGEVTVGIDDFASEESPLEAMLGVKFFPSDQIMIAYGAGTGLINGVGTPDFRAFAGVSYVRPHEEEEELPPPTVRDDCPDEPEDEDGFQDEDGCPDPDNDADGVLDVDDGCPMVPEDIDGFEDEDGCPDQDNDGDGILDRDDECPDDPEDVDGFEDEDGCPDPDQDSDGDGILDVDDECPDEAEDFDGEADEDGCPEQTRVTCTEIELEGTVNFATDSDVIQSSSFALLDEVVGIMQANESIRLIEVGGYTDDRGSAQYNQELSQRRTESVVTYLRNAGVDRDRLSARGYGEANPIATNSTPEGQAANRRVEIKILENDQECPEE